MKLTIKQENFCNKYLESGNASEAYRCAYSCSKMKAKTITRKALELMENGIITARIKELQSELKAKSDITKDDILNEYKKIAFSSIASFHKTWVTREELENLTEQQKSCIKSIKSRTRKTITDKGDLVEIDEVCIELHDKLKALDSIVKIMGFEASTKHEVTGKDGKPLIPDSDHDLSKLSVEDLILLKSLNSKMKIDEKRSGN